MAASDLKSFVHVVSHSHLPRVVAVQCTTSAQWLAWLMKWTPHLGPFLRKRKAKAAVTGRGRSSALALGEQLWRYSTDQVANVMSKSLLRRGRPPTALVLGATGAVGSQILATLLHSSTFPTTTAISRSAPPSHPNLSLHVEPATSKWAPLLSSLSPCPSTAFNAVFPTHAAARGLKAQWKIEHDLCIEIAQAAKVAGVKTYVFVSNAGTRDLLSSFVPYSKMSIGVEDAIKKLDFEHAVILRPGMILGGEKAKAWLLVALFGHLSGLPPIVPDPFGMCA